MSESPSPKEQLTTIMTHMLANPDDYGAQATAVQSLQALCRSITQWNGAALQHQTVIYDTMLDSGKALAPVHAERCLNDILRTAGFLRGIYAALTRLVARFPDQTLHLLYAGSGPFAPLVLPLLPLFAPAHLQCTILDIHAESIAMVQQIITACDLDAFIHVCTVADATTYQPDLPIHLLVTETMQRALANEPHVAIVHHLLPYLHPHGILIPEQVTIQACLADAAREFTFLDATGTNQEGRLRVDVGTVFTLDRDTIDAELQTSHTITIPAVIPPTTTTFFLLTHIRIFDTIVLGDYDSWLTYPAVLQSLDRVPPTTTLTFSYALKPIPGVQWVILPNMVTI